MDNVIAEFSLWDLRTDLLPPDELSSSGGWKQFLNPEHYNQGRFLFGDMELIVRHEQSVLIRVGGQLPNDLIEQPNDASKEHQDAVLAFYSKAFTLLNNFILRYRIRTFNYRNHPVKWSIQSMLGRKEFIVETPIRCEVTWKVDGRSLAQPAKVVPGVRNRNQTTTVGYPYPVETLAQIEQDVREVLSGKEQEESFYEAALELLMQAQEIVVTEDAQRETERRSAVIAALVATAAACEGFIRDFIRRNGTRLQKYLVKRKNQAFTVGELLDEVLREIPKVGTPLTSINAELRHNIHLLYEARNNGSHKARPFITVKKRVDEIEEEHEDYERIRTKEVQHDCPVNGWMVYEELDRHLYYSDVDGEFGSFVWDVLALIEWLRSFEGGNWLKPGVRQYFEHQTSRPAGTREQEILEIKKHD